MSDWSSLDATLAERKQQHLYRQRRVIESAQGAEVYIDGRKLLNFCSNDYLGLANHPRVIAAMQSAVSEYGVGSGASHLVCGHSHCHHQLEESLAEFLGRDRALLFSTGYMANQGIITALLDKRDFIFEDKLNHASLLDAGLLSGARFQRFLHNDLDNLRGRLEKTAALNDVRRLIVVDSVFSMDGDLAPLAELSQLASEYNAWLMIDDAHGVGVLGDTGAGSAEYFALDQTQLPIIMGTLGKALGVFGAFVAGSETLIETLIQLARPYIYTTALPPAVAASALASLQIVRDEPERREHLQQLIQQFKNGARQLGLTLMPSNSAIQPVLIGDSKKALEASAVLQQRGFFVAAIRPPTVPAGTARLRITLSAAHSKSQVEQLLEAVAEVVK